ncbi:MAG: uroporphyrinogen decarboxylase family protein [Cyclonatronaceae bacterium]
MTGYERTLAFLNRDPVDRPPFHPIIMRWAARYAGVRYRDFCLDPEAKCHAMMRCARDFDLDWVTVMSDPWAEASAFGVEVEYPEDNLPVDVGGHLPDAAAAAGLQPFDPLKNSRCRNRLAEIRNYRSRVGGEYFIAGWVEGPVAEYVDIRGASEASFDFLMDPDNVGKAMDVIIESVLHFITFQLEEGADAIGIGDAFCSQIGPDLYRQFAFERQKQLVDHIHAAGALAKLHICGNTSSILPDMIATGADIIDIDHLVPSMSDYAGMLAPHQVFSGKADPVSVIQDGEPKEIRQTVARDYRASGGRCIISAGCEITPDTRPENMHAFRKAVVATGEL